MLLTEAHIKLYQSIKNRGTGRICNDLLPEEKSILNQSQWREFAKEYHDWNGDPEEYDPSRVVMMDFMVVGFIDYLLIKNLKNK